jgi:RNA polymerase sigma-70 factor (ECF subfamily)
MQPSRRASRHLCDGVVRTPREVHVATAWDQVYAGQYRRLVALVAVVAGTLGEAEEAVQEAFVRALGPAGRGVDDPEAWLYRVAVNHVRSRWRRLSAARRHAGRFVVDETGDDTPGADERVALIAALRRLPFAQREALALHYMADMSVAEIAIRTQVPVGTVKARLSRGRDALRGILGATAVLEGVTGA